MRSGRASSSGYSLPPLLALLRPQNGLIAGCAVFVGAVVVSGGEGASRFWRGGLDWVPAMLGALAAFAAAGGANALNDALDAASDRLNAPGRPIPSGGATRVQAVRIVLFRNIAEPVYAVDNPCQFTRFEPAS